MGKLLIASLNFCCWLLVFYAGSAYFSAATNAIAILLGLVLFYFLLLKKLLLQWGWILPQPEKPVFAGPDFSVTLKDGGTQTRASLEEWVQEQRARNKVLYARASGVFTLIGFPLGGIILVQKLAATHGGFEGPVNALQMAYFSLIPMLLINIAYRCALWRKDLPF